VVPKAEVLAGPHIYTDSGLHCALNKAVIECIFHYALHLFAYARRRIEVAISSSDYKIGKMFHASAHSGISHVQCFLASFSTTARMVTDHSNAPQSRSN
jgi:hypothetical protein